MKKCILSCFFVFQVIAYAQDGTITNANFENKLIVSDTDGGITNEIKPTSSIANKSTSNRFYLFKEPIKKINISNNIDLDYWVFTKKQFISLYILKKSPYLRHSSNRLKDLNVFKIVV